jgi:hypothetical protein
MRCGAVMPPTSRLTRVPHDDSLNDFIRDVLESPPGCAELRGVRKPNELCIGPGQRIPRSRCHPCDAVDVAFDLRGCLSVRAPGSQRPRPPLSGLHLPRLRPKPGLRGLNRTEGPVAATCAGSAAQSQKGPLGASRRLLEGLHMPEGQKHYRLAPPAKKQHRPALGKTQAE